MEKAGEGFCCALPGEQMKLNESSQHGGPLGVFARRCKKGPDRMGEANICARSRSAGCEIKCARGPEHKRPAPLPAQGHVYYNLFCEKLIIMDLYWFYL